MEFALPFTVLLGAWIVLYAALSVDLATAVVAGGAGFALPVGIGLVLSTGVSRAVAWLQRAAA
jgi:hypothetical protein